MIIGIPKERKQGESRVVLTPSDVSSITSKATQVLIETQAGVSSGFEDSEFLAAGARIANSLSEVWESSQLIVKVKEPAPEERKYFRKDLAIFSFLHPAAHPDLVNQLLDSGCIGIDFDLISEKKGDYPILAPMSQIAGCLSIFCGASALQPSNGGRGILLSGLTGVDPASVLVIGAGIAGSAAAEVAFSNGARVCILDINPLALKKFEGRGERLRPLLSTEAVLIEEIKTADLIVGAVLVPGDCAPKLITREMLKYFMKGAALVDICIDQGGISESSRPTSIAEPVYLEQGVVHYCVPNMPALVPRSATIALSKQVRPWLKILSESGISKAINTSLGIKNAVVTHNGEICNDVVRNALLSARP